METKQKQPWFLCAPVARYKDIIFDAEYQYDYRLQIILDIHSFCLFNDYKFLDILRYGYSSVDEVIEELENMCFDDDFVTGNGSGSYWFSSWYAELALCHNWDLIKDALSEFGDVTCFNFLDASAETLDVQIRCYLLHECVAEYVSQMWCCYVED